MPESWDTSAIIHTCVPGQSASAARRILGQPRRCCLVDRTVEVRSTLERLRKELTITQSLQRFREQARRPAGLMPRDPAN